MTGNAQADLFLALALVVGTARLLGAALTRVGQPPVVGEILTGILLGPMILPASVSGHLLPDSTRPALTALASVGLATFMFLVGYETEAVLPRGSRRLPFGIAVGGTLVPLAGGMALALPLAPSHAAGGKVAFVLFVGVAMSVTAFPVLARIVADRDLHRSRTGAVVLVAAAVGDLVAWVCLAAIVAYAEVAVPWRIALLPLYAGVMVFVVRPSLAVLLRRAESRETGGAAFVFPVLAVGLLGSAAATEWLGLHFIFGAFAFGAVMPRSLPEPLRDGIATRMRQTGALLLPVYFAVAGVKVNLAGTGAGGILTLILLVVVATVTKTLGVYAGGRLCGADRGQSLTAAVLMNTRGLTEIVIVSVGLDLGLIDRTFYSLMVLMALVTTILTVPALTVLGRSVPHHEFAGETRASPARERSR
ncbi:cation:proton antiporter domain-containing protein [Streptomyces sp. HUAS TT7]|uniref:cation:proton antiporter domain-containing protein n=1 Tax=Streptomyces sp. HUAS TT7 TaxID=3447507 RepID=UPI003F65CCD6